MPEADLPAIDDAELAEVVARPARARGRSTRCAACRSCRCCRGDLSFAQGASGRRRGPEAIVVPTGNRVRLTYEAGRPPVLAVRLQELFGLAETPRVAGGRVPVLLHLLGPNYRPVQVTDDLKSFWNTTYFQVRKDLRNRYPKHSWPEDPWNARPEAKGSRRSS